VWRGWVAAATGVLAHTQMPWADCCTDAQHNERWRVGGCKLRPHGPFAELPCTRNRPGQPAPRPGPTWSSLMSWPASMPLQRPAWLLDAEHTCRATCENMGRERAGVCGLRTALQAARTPTLDAALGDVLAPCLDEGLPSLHRGDNASAAGPGPGDAGRRDLQHSMQQARNAAALHTLTWHLAGPSGTPAGKEASVHGENEGHRTQMSTQAGRFCYGRQRAAQLHAPAMPPWYVCVFQAPVCVLRSLWSLLWIAQGERRCVCVMGVDTSKRRLCLEHVWLIWCSAQRFYVLHSTRT
jgi:hypothetical protein